MLWCGRGIVWAVWLVVLTCGVLRQVEAAADSPEMDSDTVREEKLRWMTEMTSDNLGDTCMTPPLHRLARVPLGVGRYDSARQKADLVARVLASLTSRSPHRIPDQELVKGLVVSLVSSGMEVVAARVLLKTDPSSHASPSSTSLLRLTQSRRPHQHHDAHHYSPPATTTAPPTPHVNTSTVKVSWALEEPWYYPGAVGEEREEEEMMRRGRGGGRGGGQWIGGGGGGGAGGAARDWNNNNNNNNRSNPNPTHTKFQQERMEGSLGNWTFPYFQCNGKRWILSYTAPITRSSTATTDTSTTTTSSYTGSRPSSSSSLMTLRRSLRNSRRHDINTLSDLGLVSLDVDVTSLDINQCDPPEDDPHSYPYPYHQQGKEPPFPPYITFFQGTHKCHRTTSVCEPRSGMGLARGGYVCRCMDDHFPKNKTFNGSVVEVAWEGLELQQNPTYDILYRCRKCPDECPGCEDDKPCTAYYNWPFRIALLTISSLCMVFTFVLMGLVCHYRSVKVFRLASPTFLCICLIGCAIMYLEMAAIFPVLDTYSCVATKWTRHLGFCVTFSSLLMKTWRVSLTYRVTSAHKIKLTDKQLLQWLTPILLIVLVYLGAWSLSATPSAEYIRDYSNLKFKQCKYDWWDHTLALGEVLFLMWGVKVCFSVRKAESFFNEAKYISYAVYNIAVVNIVMVTFHLIIFPHAGPDIKYLLGFLRTQFSTSTTVLLIFGPKFYRIVQGTGDQYDNRARAKGVTASFSLNGLGVMDDEPPNLSQENEELKEEIQKLAAQMEFMKIVHMEMNNRHLKPKPGGYFSDKNSSVLAAQSPGTKPTTTPTTTIAAAVVATTTTTITTTAAKAGVGVVGAGGAGGGGDSGNENSSSARLSPGAEVVASEKV